MDGLSVLDVGHICCSYDEFLLLFIIEDLTVERDSLLLAKVPLIEATLVCRALLQFVKQGFKCLDPLLLFQLLKMFLVGVHCLQCPSLSKEFNLLNGLLNHMRRVKLR